MKGVTISRVLKTCVITIKSFIKPDHLSFIISRVFVISSIIPLFIIPSFSAIFSLYFSSLIGLKFFMFELRN